MGGAGSPLLDCEEEKENTVVKKVTEYVLWSNDTNNSVLEHKAQCLFWLFEQPPTINQMRLFYHIGNHQIYVYIYIIIHSAF